MVWDATLYEPCINLVAAFFSGFQKTNDMMRHKVTIWMKQKKQQHNFATCKNSCMCHDFSLCTQPDLTKFIYYLLSSNFVLWMMHTEMGSSSNSNNSFILNWINISTDSKRKIEKLVNVELKWREKWAHSWISSAWKSVKIIVKIFPECSKLITSMVVKERHLSVFIHKLCIRILTWATYCFCFNTTTPPPLYACFIISCRHTRCMCTFYH